MTTRARRVKHEVTPANRLPIRHGKSHKSVMAQRRFLVLTQCFPPDAGGVERVMGALAAALARVGEVEVLADEAGRRGLIAAPVGPRIRRFGGLKPLRRRLKALAAAGRAKGVDAIFADSWKSVELLAPPAAPLIVLAHGMEFPPEPRPAKAARIRAALAKATAIAANSADTAARLAPFAPAGAKLAVVNPPVDPPAPADPADMEALRARIGEGPIVATLARLEPRKGVDQVIRALPGLPGVRHAVAGDGPDRPRLEALARELAVDDRVTFLGRVSEAEKSALYALSEVFAMPARAEGASVEGFGLVYLEAAWFGVPSVAGREGGAADAVQDGETGLLCDGGDAADVAAALGRLLRDPDLRRRLGAAARLRAQRAGWDAGLDRYLALAGL